MNKKKLCSLIAAFVAATAPAADIPTTLNVADMQKWRQDFHRVPETAFEEVRTSAIVAGLLQSWGIETHTNIGKTGVIGVLRGQGTGGPRIGLRADMDALPIQEAPDHVPYASTVSSKMHACGHDGHMAMLLGAAEQLAKTRNFNGTVYFIFQPGEEKGGGAQAIVDDGFFKKFPCDRIFGMHAWPGLPAGKIGVGEGPITAAADVYKITVNGSGGHAAYPQFAKDPLAPAMRIAQKINAYKPVTGEGDAVFGVTTFHGGDAPNVIPNIVTLSGTVRSFAAATRDDIESAIKNMAAAETNVTVNVSYTREVSAVVNAPQETDLARQAAENAVGKDNIVSFSRTMGAEDFSVFSGIIPGAYVALGQAVEGKPNGFLHSAGFDFNDETLKAGAAYWVHLVEKALPVKNSYLNISP